MSEQEMQKIWEMIKEGLSNMPPSSESAWSFYLDSVPVPVPGVNTTWDPNLDGILGRPEAHQPRVEDAPDLPVMSLLPPKENIVNLLRHILDVTQATHSERKTMEKLIGKFEKK